ncbi:MAG: thioredoxin family protein, partial [Sedimentisphaerales bacterium]
MVILGQALLFQCPCSGGNGNPLLLLAAVAGIWLLVSWIRSVYRKEGVSRMNKIGKIAIVVVLIVAVVVVIVIKQNKSDQGMTDDVHTKAIPRLVDVGAKTCIPCKLMAPILEELKKEYAGRLQVDFLDLSINPDYAGQYKVRVIPTQIFYDASGKELFRHEGFYSKEDILAKFKQLGVDLTAPKLATFERL